MGLLLSTDYVMDFTSAACMEKADNGNSYFCPASASLKQPRKRLYPNPFAGLNISSVMFQYDKCIGLAH